MRGGVNMNRKELPNIEVFESAASRAWHSRFGEVSADDMRVIDAMAQQTSVSEKHKFTFRQGIKQEVVLSPSRKESVNNMNA